MKRNTLKSLLGACLALCSLGASAQGLEGVVVENYHTTNAADAAYYNGLGNGSGTMTTGLTTYRVFIDMAPGYKLNTVFGSAGNVLDFSSTTVFWNDDGYGAQFPPQTSRNDDGAAFDTWITIGRASRSGGAAGCTGNVETLGVPRAADPDATTTLCTTLWSGFGATDKDGTVPGASADPTLVGISQASLAPFIDVDGGNAFTTTGSWALLPPLNGPDANGSNLVLIGQFTTSGTFSFHINISLQTPGGQVEFYTHSSSESGSTVSPYLTFPLVLPPDCNGVPGGPAVPGSPCNDNNACTINDVYTGVAPNCGCAGTFQDTDSDGTCDANDPCPTQANVVPGQSCNDGDACTINDVITANCGCAGTFQDTDSDGTCDANDPCPTQANVVPGQSCNDNDPCTINDVITANCGCAGTFQDTDSDGTCDANDPCPTQANAVPGQSCNDGDACTINDVITANCGCAGTLQDSDSDGVCDANDACPLLPFLTNGDPCNDGNPNTSNDVVTNCVCAGTLANDCNGVPGGPAQPGTACNDNNACTINDVFDANCNCAGTFQDTDSDGTCDANDPCPTQANVVPGQSCNDGNACTINDVITANCGCAGTFQDTDSDGTCDANDPCPTQANVVPGQSCNDGDACTINDVITANCGCAGTLQDSDSDGVCDANDACPLLPFLTNGDPCNDGNPNTSNDVVTNCVCAGTLANDCNGVPGGPAQPGTACNDNNACTINDVFDANCNCAGTFQDTDSDGICNANDNCPSVAGVIGSPCNDNNPNTENDALNANCQCVGTPIGGGCLTNELQLVIEADGVSTTLWEVRAQGSNAVVASGGQLYPSGIFNENICLPDGCYYLVVTDDNNDGITGGGYILRTVSGKRIIDNADNFSTGSTSQIANNEGFCLPLGIDRLVQSSCDKYDWRNSDYVVVNANPAVSAEFGGANAATSGYQIWFYNPNGGYSFKRFQSHTTANGLAANATRACHFRVNGWVGNQLQNNVLYNVRVRSRVAGVNAEWGTACRFILDPLRAQCPLTQLSDVAGASLSCGATRNWGSGNYIQAKPVTRVNANNVLQSANKYQFRFRLQDETIAVVRTSNTYGLQLNWGINPLQPGLTYLVDVRASFDNGATWCTDFIQPSVDPWGVVCTLTINSNAGFGGGQNMQEEGIAETAAHLSMYPNPNRGDQLMINLSAVEEGVRTVSIEMHDLFGKRVSASTTAVNDGFLSTTLDLNGTIAAGMYQVTITAGDRIYSERLVIQP